MEADFDRKYFETLKDVIAKLGLANVKNFGLTWQDCDDFLRKLGYQARVELVEMEVT